MKLVQRINVLLALVILLASCGTAKHSADTASYNEPYRPQMHFSPATGWMNDPNGMVYHNGTYHLFYQFYPDSTVWGPMHWGHATSSDLVHWQHQPVALYPDSLGYIFSGSAVADVNNTSGFGKDGKAPLVAIFTHHNAARAKLNTGDHETQSIAYSLDDGKTWTKYAGNPVLTNPGIADFRDPKVSWYEPQKKWVMTLATKDRITFYSSPNLKDWTKESEFGKDLGAHGGVWECPDLFALDNNGKKVWVLLVNLNPGGPNGGSATQYFLGDFDGHEFKPYSTETRWLDYGPDEYAGITWSNTGDRKVFLGWMSNWLYAQVVPTSVWRSALTIPRELALVTVNNKMHVASKPVDELNKISGETKSLQNIINPQYFNVGQKVENITFPARLQVDFNQANDFSISVGNQLGEHVTIGYDKAKNEYYIDRSQAGKADFYKEFAARHTAPRFSTAQRLPLTLVFDVNSVELFADDGISVMTEIYFPSEPFNQLTITAANNTINTLQYTPLNSIWKK